MKTCIFDWKRTLYNPDTRRLIDGATELLDYLHGQVGTLILVGKGSDDMRDEVQRLGLEAYFTDIRFRTGDKDASLFAGLVDPVSPLDTTFVGDRIRSELAVGNSLGATTIWVRQGKFSDEIPEAPEQTPTHTVTSLHEVLSLLKR